MSASILVTGGAGFIGSHVVCQLAEAGYDNIVVLDNLSSGFKESVLYGQLVVGDVRDKSLVSQILETYRIDTVLHFAASIIVPESVREPLKYYGNNTCGTRLLLESCAEAGISHFVFSSTAAVYGVPAEIPMNEKTPPAPISPYGTSKLMSEWMIRDLAQVTDMRYVILRYFNAAGCDNLVRIGQSTPNTNFIFKVACEAALGLRESVSIFGTDYPTRDGTGLRDYIHIEDLSSAHLKALEYLRSGGESTILNCGYGNGQTVREVLESVMRVTGKKIHVKEEGRRPGDPPCLLADVSKIKQVLDWKPAYDSIDVISRSAFAWEKKLAAAGRLGGISSCQELRP